jgi:hypothetical protein
MMKAIVKVQHVTRLVLVQSLIAASSPRFYPSVPSPGLLGTDGLTVLRSTTYLQVASPPSFTILQLVVGRNETSSTEFRALVLLGDIVRIVLTMQGLCTE